MMKHVAIAVLTLVVVFQAAPVHAADLAAAKALYASASYEDALAMLSSLEATESLEQLNQIRALCLLALGRTTDAERAVEQIIVHNPAYELEDADVSPKLVTLFHEVRRRALPAAARAMYAKAKASYDDKHWADAKRDFSKMLQIVADPDIAEQQPALADLQQLGEGFLRLSEAEIAVEAKQRAAEEAAAAAAAQAAAALAAAAPAADPAPGAQPPPPSASGTAAPAPAASAPAAARGPVREVPGEVPVYSALDRDVTPPVEQRRVMPRWAPSDRTLTRTSYSGLLEIVIDETGFVSSASLVESVTPLYDEALTRATRSWRYVPAKRAGKPVRYRQVLEIVLRPAPQE
jgi:tetratricopeptide (TPR) repeat protein